MLESVRGKIIAQHIFGDWGIGLHAALGNAAFTIAVLIAIIAFAAFHIPLGVAVFGAVVYQLLVAWPTLIGYSSTAVGEPPPDGA